MSVSNTQYARAGKAKAADVVETVGVGRAAQELELKRGEFELAVQLGHIRTTTSVAGGRRLVARPEIARLRAAEGFPDTLRAWTKTVGTAEGARLMAVSPGRFTRLARAGCLTPARFYLNRYRVIVWLYLADELRAFAAKEPALLTGRLPRSLAALADEEDRRSRNWRGRRIGHLLRQSEDPWERAAVLSGVLDSVQLAEIVRDPYERAYLRRLAPDLALGHPDSEAAQAAMRRLLVADHPDELQWHRTGLGVLLDEARRVRPAPRPGPAPGRDPAAARDGLSPYGGDHGAPIGGGATLPRRSAGVPDRGGRGGLLTRLRVARGRRPVPGPAAPR
ncbi:DUF6397 family protein [Streptomyces sp. NPDC088725]|uniref:DUF6397 family protein n=1 Tax=Streptomyces sp. NPDC088725 TaxID=3365873 RepID=UPI003826B8E2